MMRKMNVRVHVLVYGRVQGVFFRVETRNEAIKRNVVGWIRNTLGGKVEAIFEGEKTDVDQLIDFCRRGPLGAKVSGIDVQWEDYTGKFNSFKIQKTV